MRVLLCVNECQSSLQVLNWYLNQLHQSEHHVSIVNVYQKPKVRYVSPYGPLVSGSFMRTDKYTDEKQLVTQVQTISAKITAKFRDVCAQKCIKVQEFNIAKTDDIGQSIVKLAEEIRADEIIMGVGCAGVIRRTIFGSVQDQVLRHTNLPVLIIPTIPTSNI